MNSQGTGTARIKARDRLFKSFVIFILLTEAVCAVSHTGMADSIKLRDGTVLEGHVGAMSDNGEYYFHPDNPKEEPRWISVNDIDTLRFGPVPVTQATRDHGKPGLPEAAAQK